MEWVEAACKDGAAQHKACKLAGISERSLQRWRLQGQDSEDRRAMAPRPAPGNRLTDAERARILEICNSERFQSLPPSQIVPILLDEGIYIGSVSSFYRVLKAAGQQHSRGRQQKPVKREPATHKATAPNQLWSWDISWLNSPVRGHYYYLYMIVDVYSRLITGWEIHETESAEQAAELIRKACLRHGIGLNQSELVLHSDNGSPMKGSTMLSTLHQLGVAPSFSRPRVSNDNAYSESLFRTLKYRPAYPPQAFESLGAARTWVQGFVTWYNEEHRHSGLKFQTPMDRHSGRSEEKIQRRIEVLSAAKERHPERWGNRSIRDWHLPDEVVLNPVKEISGGLLFKQAA